MKTTTRFHAASIAAAALALASTAQADWTWSGGNNADLYDPANWTGSNGAYLIPANASGLYLSQNWTCVTNMHLTADGTTVSFDLGSERTLSFSDFQFFFTAKNATVEFLSGTIMNTAKEMNLLSSDNWGTNIGGNTFRLKGANTFLDSTKTSIFSYHGSGSTFEICDGARFNGGFRYGNSNPKSQTLFIHDGGAFTNTSASGHVTQNGNTGLRTIVSGATFSVPSGPITYTGSDQSFAAKDSATVYTSGAFTLGNKSEYNGNSLEVSGGSSLSAQMMQVGTGGSALNEALITGAGTEVDSKRGLYVGGRNSSGVSNTVTVADHAILKITEGVSGYDNLVIGASGGWNSLVVESGAVVTNYASGTPRLGQNSSHNSIDIEGGKLHLARCIHIGDSAGADSNTVSIANGVFRGGTYYCAFHVGGNGGSFNEVEVRNGGLLELGVSRGWTGRNPGNGNDNSYVGFGSGASCNAIRVLTGGVFRCPDVAKYGQDSYHTGSKLNIGFSANTCSNRLEVLGGTAKIGIIYVGGTNETSVANALVVSNGTVNSSSVYVSQDTTLPAGTPFAAPNTLLVKGTSSLVKTTANLVFYEKGELSLDLTDGVYGTIPLQATGGALEFKTGSTIKVKNTKAIARAGSAKVVVARRSAGAITLASGLLETWNAALVADKETKGCEFSLANNDKDLVLKIGGEAATILCFR